MADATKEELRANVEAAVLKEIEKFGPTFNRAGVVERFEGHGVSRATLYRWVDALMRSGAPGQHITKVVKKAAQARAKRTDDPAADAAREVVEVLPAVPSAEDIAGLGVGSIVDKLNTCMKVAEELMNHARADDGTPRNSKMLLAASEHLRRSTETVVRIQEAMQQVMYVERFHEAVFDVLREEDPRLVERVLLRLRQVNNQFGLA